MTRITIHEAEIDITTQTKGWRGTGKNGEKAGIFEGTFWWKDCVLGRQIMDYSSS